MIRDKYSAVWVSYSSLQDYVKCPRAYFLRNVYRDPKSRRKITIMQPALALGQAVHAVIDELSLLPVAERFSVPLSTRFNAVWQGVSGKRGGFTDKNEEAMHKDRGLSMIARVEKNPAPLLKKAVKLRQSLPHFWLSPEDGVILCGKIDWLIYDEENDGVKIMDFKTGRFDEDPDSLQLPIYALIVSQVQNRPVTGMLYWYLDRDDEPLATGIPDPDKTREEVLEVAKRISLARKVERFVCLKKDGCMHCSPYEQILLGQAKYVGQDGYNQDVYILPSQRPESRT